MSFLSNFREAYGQEAAWANVSAPSGISKHATIPELVERLTLFHRDCFLEFLPRIEADLASVQKASEKHPLFMAALTLGMKALKDDLRVHFLYEETNLYPYALALFNRDTRLPDYNCDKFLSEHPVFRINFSDLLSLMQKYASDFSDHFAYRILHQRLRGWNDEFAAHEALEDFDLIARLRSIELSR